MGGLAGHIQHIHENIDLTFADVEQILFLAKENKLKNVQEKIDGQNIFFTYDTNKKILKFARNKTDIKNGGFIYEDIVHRWKHLINVKETYCNAYLALENFLSLFQDNIFQTNHNKIWISAEVIFSNNSNVIKYDDNVIILHGSYTFDNNGNVIDKDINFNKLQFLTKKHDKIIVNNLEWKIKNSIYINLKNNIKIEKYFSFIDNEMIKPYNLSKNDKIRFYLKKRFKENIENVLCSNNEKEKLANIYISKKMLGQKKKEALEVVNTKEIKDLFLVKNQQILQKTFLQPLEKILYEFSIDLLKDKQSILIKKSNDEICRIKNVVNETINKINISGNPKKIHILESNRIEIKKIENLSSTIEGIVFTYKNEKYKLTGMFPTINNILGLMRY